VGLHSSICYRDVYSDNFTLFLRGIADVFNFRYMQTVQVDKRTTLRGFNIPICTCTCISNLSLMAVAYPGIFFGGGSVNSVEDRRQMERGSVGDSPLNRAEFTNG
jgi:hypothetical protein